MPNCRAYDPCFAGELAVILDHGMRQMLERQEDVFYYVTLMNENYAQPSLPAGVEADVITGMYRYAAHAAGERATATVRLLGSGTILREVIAAAELLASDWGVAAEVWSATSFSELAREAREVERFNRLHPSEPARTSHVQHCLAGDAPVIAATDYVRAWPQLIAPYLSAPFTALGTDGFGRSDTRAALAPLLRGRSAPRRAGCADRAARPGRGRRGHLRRGHRALRTVAGCPGAVARLNRRHYNSANRWARWSTIARTRVGTCRPLGMTALIGTASPSWSSSKRTSLPARMSAATSTLAL